MDEALKILLYLAESVAMRLRGSNSLCGLVVVGIKTSQFAYSCNFYLLLFYTILIML